MVVAHIAVCQYIVAQHLAVAQASAVPQHNPCVRAQYGYVVGHGFGVARAHADIDHGDAAVPWAHQMVSGHLRQALGVRALHKVGRGGAACMVGDDVAWLDKSGVATARIKHGGLPQTDEFVYVKLVVGKQYKVLKMHGIGTAVVAQALQRIIYARGGKKRQRLRGAGRCAVSVAMCAAVRAVGNAVIHGGQVGPIKAGLHALALRVC